MLPALGMFRPEMDGTCKGAVHFLTLGFLIPSVRNVIALLAFFVLKRRINSPTFLTSCAADFKQKNDIRIAPAERYSAGVIGMSVRRRQAVEPPP